MYGVTVTLMAAMVTLTLKFLKFLIQTGLHIVLQLTQSGRLQYLKVDLDLVWVAVTHRGL